MYKIFTLAAMGLMALSSSLNAQTNTIIGAGSNAGTTSNAATGDAGPMYNTGGTSTFFYSRHHMVYTQTELAAAGMNPGELIQKISWRKANNAAIISTATIIFDIHLKNSSLTAVPAAPQDYNTLITGASLVYSSTNQNFLADTGWVEFTLTTPFLYTGGALELTTHWDMSAAGTGVSTANFAWYKDPANIISHTAGTASLTLNNNRTVRAQIRFTHVPNAPCVDPPVPGAATVSANSICAGQQISLGLSGTGFGAGQAYQWQESADSLTWVDIIGATNPSHSLLQSMPTAWYRCNITCGNTTLPSTATNAVILQSTPLAGGTYTAGGPTSNFPSLDSLSNLLACAGIAGPVNILLQGTNGILASQLSLGAIAGTGPGSPLTIWGIGDTLQATGNNAAAIILNGSSYVNIRNLVIRATGVKSGIMMNNVQHIDIKENLLILDQTSTSSVFGGIIATGNFANLTTGTTANFVNVDSNIIRGGYAGIRFNGLAGARNQFVNVRYNTVNDWYIHGIFMLQTEYANVSNNEVSRPTRTGITTFNGIYMSTGTFGALVNANRIHSSNAPGASLTAAANGIFFLGASATPTEPNIVSNNLIYNLNSGSGTLYGIYNSGGSSNYFYHNTVVLDHAASTAGITYGVYILGTGTDNQVLNNIVYISRGGTGTKYCLYYLATNTPVSNNNVLNMFSTGGTANHIGFFGSAQTSMAAWQAVNNGSFDQNSSINDPIFVSPATGNFEPSNFAVNGIGANLQTLVSVDIRNMPRTATPSPGAYEFIVTGCFGTQNESVGTITHNSAQAVWISANNRYQLSYGPAGTAAGAGTIVTTTSIPYTITGLSPNTAYDVYIRDTCDIGTVTAWSPVVSFTTLRDFDLRMAAILDPADNACGDASMPVRVVVRNNGNLPMTGYSAQVAVSGALTASINATSTAALQPGETDTLTVGTINSSAGGTITLAASLQSTQDLYADNDTLSSTVGIISVSSPIVASSADTVCVGDPVSLWVTNTSPNSSMIWEDASGTQIGTGDTLSIPAVSGTSTYSVRGLGTVNYSVGPADTTIGAAASFAGSSLNAQSLLITALVPVKFTRARVYVENTGWMVVMLRDLSGNEIVRDSVFVTQNGPAYAPVVVNINLDIPAGSYRLGALASQSAGGMLRNSAGQTPPYTVPGVFSIDGNTFGAGYHYYYYDMVVSVGGCATPVTSKTITALTSPTANFTLNTQNLPTIQVDASSSQNTFGYYWDFGDGNVTTLATATHTYTANGTYDVMLIAYGECRDDTMIQQVTVMGLNVNDITGASALKLYPNPNSGSFTVSYEDDDMQRAELRIMDMQGRLVRRMQLEPTAVQVQQHIELEGVAAGMYQLSISNQKGVMRSKFSVSR
jgi:hypothetical protein